MKPIIHTALCGLAAVFALTATAAAKPVSADPRLQRVMPVATTDGAPIVLAARPGSAADGLARQLLAREIERARASGTEPLVLVGMARLNDEDELLFVQLQSPSECGSAGCSTLSFRYAGDQWVRILDTVGGPVRIASSGRGGMPDLIVQDRQRLVWDGTKYVG